MDVVQLPQPSLLIGLDVFPGQNPEISIESKKNSNFRKIRSGIIDYLQRYFFLPFGTERREIPNYDLLNS